MGIGHTGLYVKITINFPWHGLWQLRLCAPLIGYGVHVTSMSCWLEWGFPQGYVPLVPLVYYSLLFI